MASNSRPQSSCSFITVCLTVEQQCYNLAVSHWKRGAAKQHYAWIVTPEQEARKLKTSSAINLGLRRYFFPLLSITLTNLLPSTRWRAFLAVEVPCVRLISQMELNGLGMSRRECAALKNVLLTRRSALEQKAYKLAGHIFSLNSLDDIAEVLPSSFNRKLVFIFIFPPANSVLEAVTGKMSV